MREVCVIVVFAGALLVANMPTNESDAVATATLAIRKFGRFTIFRDFITESEVLLMYSISQLLICSLGFWEFYWRQGSFSAFELVLYCVWEMTDFGLVMEAMVFHTTQCGFSRVRLWNLNALSGLCGFARDFLQKR